VGLSRSFRVPGSFDERRHLDQLDEVLQSADILVCALLLNKFTKNFLNRASLQRAKRNLILVNISRAEIINESDIYKILVENPEMRFGTDVFWRMNSKESFDSKLWSLPNFVGTLHRAGASASPEVKQKAVEHAVRNVRSFLLTGEAQNLVRREDYV
jgi:D-3-phosphoglycerate dehydrogenase